MLHVNSIKQGQVPIQYQVVCLYEVVVIVKDVPLSTNQKHFFVTVIFIYTGILKIIMLISFTHEKLYFLNINTF